MSVELPAEIQDAEDGLDALQIEAANQIEATDEIVEAMGSEKSRLIVTVTILTIFGLALFGYGAWAIWGTTTGFICADQAAETAKVAPGTGPPPAPPSWNVCATSCWRPRIPPRKCSTI